MSRYLTLFTSMALGLFLAACTPPRSPEAHIPTGVGQLKVNFSGFRNDLGEAVIFIYPNALGFPEEDAPEIIHRHQPIHDHQVQLTLDNLPYHVYAIAVLHDENRNGRMDKSLLGFPIEGFGFSLNPKPRLAPPKYQESRFLFVSQSQQLSIQLQYPTRRKLHSNQNGPPPGRLKSGST